MHAITFLISCEYVSVNWSDSSLKHEMHHVFARKAVLIPILEQVCVFWVKSSVTEVGLAEREKKKLIILDIALFFPLQEETTGLS